MAESKSNAPAGSGSDYSPDGTSGSLRSTKPPSPNTKNTAAKLWRAFGDAVCSIMMVLFITIVTELIVPQEYRPVARMVVLLLLVLLIRSVTNTKKGLIDSLKEQSLFMGTMDREIAFRGAVIWFYQHMLTKVSENAFIGKIREFFEDSPADKVMFGYEPPEKVNIRVGDGETWVDIDYNELVRDWLGTLDQAKTEFMAKYYGED